MRATNFLPAKWVTRIARKMAHDRVMTRVVSPIEDFR
jgi:hypothetical protein